MYCKVTLTEADVNTFVYAVTNQYSYQMYLDDMPIWGMVGEVRYYLFVKLKITGNTSYVDLSSVLARQC